jgi:hypothetical protein
LCLNIIYGASLWHQRSITQQGFVTCHRRLYLGAYRTNSVGCSDLFCITLSNHANAR